MSNIDDIKLDQKTAKPGKDAIRYSIRYVLYSAAIFGLINLLDIFASNASPLIQSYVAEEFFISQGIEESVAYSRMNLLSIIGLPITLLALAFRFLADKYGRKPVLVINIIGMSLGAVLIAFSQNFGMFLLGNIISSLFLSTDIQLMMITEEAPVDQRSRYIAFARIIGLVGAILVPLSRGIFLSGTNPNWRAIFYFPIILGIVCTLITVFTIRESSVYLTMRQQEQQTSEANESSLKFGKALKLAWKSPNIKPIIIVSIVAVLGTFGGMAERSFMEPLLSAQFTLQDVNTIYYLRYFISMGLGVVIGTIRDKMGRKIGLIITLIVQIVFLILFSIALRQNWVWMVGLTYGIFIYAIFMNSVTGLLIINELTNTKVRGSMSIINMIVSFGLIIIWMVIQGVLIRFFTFEQVIWIATIPFSLIGIIIAYFKIPETVGTDLTTIDLE